MKRNLAIVLSLVFVFAASLSGCTQDTPQSSGAVNADGVRYVGDTSVVYNADLQEDGVKRLGIAYSTLQYEASQLLVEGYRNRYAEFGFDEIVVLTAEGDLEKQINQIQDLVNQGCDMIIVNSVDQNGVAQVCRDTMEKGVAIVAVDRKIGTDIYYTLETDNTSAGRDLAMTFADYTYTEGIADGSVHTLLCVGDMTSSAVNDRVTGFRETAANYPWLNIVAEPSCLQTSEVYDGVIDALTADPTIRCIMVVGDNDVTPAVSALRELGMLRNPGDPDYIYIGSVDGAANAIEAIRNGESSFCANQRFDLFCTQILQVCQDYMNGVYVAPSANEVKLPCAMIMRQNVDHLERIGLLWAMSDL